MLSLHLDNNSQSTQESILLHLKRKGEMTVAQLSEVLGITEMAVRRHLTHLQSENLVESRLVKRERGRPNYFYRLGPQAKSLFPSGSKNMARDILQVIHDESGPQGVADLLKKRNQMVINKLKGCIADKDLAQRVAEVAKFFSDEGFMTEWKQLPDGSFVIYQGNCALHDLASEFRQICALEPKLIEELLGVKVVRQQHIFNNDPVCGYLVTAHSDNFKS